MNERGYTWEQILAVVEQERQRPFHFGRRRQLLLAEAQIVQGPRGWQAYLPVGDGYNEGNCMDDAVGTIRRLRQALPRVTMGVRDIGEGYVGNSELSDCHFRAEVCWGDRVAVVDHSAFYRQHVPNAVDSRWLSAEEEAVLALKIKDELGRMVTPVSDGMSYCEFEYSGGVGLVLARVCYTRRGLEVGVWAALPGEPRGAADFAANWVWPSGSIEWVVGGWDSEVVGVYAELRPWMEGWLGEILGKVEM